MKRRAAPPRAPTPRSPGSRAARARRAAPMAALVLFLLALALVGWSLWPQEPHSIGTTHAPEVPDVLLVTVDTLRADHLGCYGDSRAATPAIDALASRGARFVEAIAQVPLTLPSHASILTGVTPLVHGVRDNAGFVLGTSTQTVAEAFEGQGYETAAFVSGFPVHHRFGLARGFGAYDDRFPRGDDPSRPPYIERRANETVAVAAKWLEEASRRGRTKPVFVWVHLFDPHAPYDAPEPQRSSFRDRPYDGEIAFVDAQVAAFLARWRTLRPGREPLIALTADHGEGLGEHGEPTHGLFIYDSTIRVPLIVSGPGVRAGTVVKGAVRTIDIAPTLLDLAGLRPMRRVEGRSLRRAIVSGRADDEPAYAESLFGRLGFGWAPLHGWRDRGLMLIDAPRPEIYDTSNDPAQARNLAAGRGGDLARMRRALQAAVARAPEAKPSTPSPETSERLRSLGYVASGPVGSPSLRDPKDFAALAALVETAISLERANPAKAAADLRTALKADPDNAVARRHLAMALVNARRFDAAAGELTILLAAGDDSLETLTLLGDSYRLSGRLAQALDTFTWAVSKDGHAPEGYNGQGKVLTGLGRTEDARRAFERALQAAPDDAEALEGLADLALARGDLAEAQRQLDALAQRDPDDSRVALKRGVVLVRLGELDGAIAIFRAVADREPANAEAAVDLGGALAKSGRAAEAVPYFERAITAGAGGPVVWNGLAMARLETGNQAGAVQALRQSLRARPDQPNIKDMLERLQRQ